MRIEWAQLYQVIFYMTRYIRNYCIGIFLQDILPFFRLESITIIQIPPFQNVLLFLVLFDPLK